MYMGMQMFDAFQANGESRTYDWRKTNNWLGWKGAETLPYVRTGRTVEELNGLQKQALREFYMRPQAGLRFLGTISSIYDVQKYLAGFRVLIKNRISPATGR